MKKLFLFLPLAALLFAVACSDDDDYAEPYVIEIPEITSDISLDDVKVTYMLMYSNVSDEYEIVGYTNCTLSSLKINLLAVPAKKNLSNIKDIFGDGYYSISNSNARIGIVMDFFASNYLNNIEQHYCYTLIPKFDGDFDSGEVKYYYSDRDVNIDGRVYVTTANGDKFMHINYDNVRLKKGWNRIAQRYYANPYPLRVYSMDIPDDTYWIAY